MFGATALRNLHESRKRLQVVDAAEWGELLAQFESNKARAIATQCAIHFQQLNILTGGQAMRLEDHGRAAAFLHGIDGAAVRIEVQRSAGPVLDKRTRYEAS